MKITLVAVIILAAVALVGYCQNAEAGDPGMDIVESNITESSFTLSWITDSPTTGYIMVNGDRYDDIRGSVTDDVHMVHVEELEPGQTYNWKIYSGGADTGEAGSVLTPDPVGPSSPYTIFGQVDARTGGTSSNALVYAQWSGQIISAMADSSGFFQINLAQFQGFTGSGVMDMRFNGGGDGAYPSRIDQWESVALTASPQNIGTITLETAEIPMPDLYLESSDITFSSGPYGENDPITITARIHNQGDVPSESADVSFWDGTMKIDTRTIGAINVGDDLPTSTQWIPVGVGTHTIRVTIDTVDPGDGDGSNDEAQRDISIVEDKPDLVITNDDVSFTPAGPYGEGDVVTIVASIYNAGLKQADSYTVTFKDGSTTIGTPQAMGALPSDGTIQVYQDWTASGVKVHTISVEVSGSNPAESETGNNKGQNTIDVRKNEPDMSISAPDITFDPPSPVANNTQVTIFAMVENLGIVTASNVDVSLYQGDPAQGGILQDTLTINNVDPGAQVTESFFWESPLEQEDEDYKLYIKLSGIVPADTTTSNDKAYKTMTVFAPDKPKVVSTEPALYQVVGQEPVVEINFNLGMNKTSVEEAFSIDPVIAGEFTWVKSKTLRFDPYDTLDQKTYTVSIADTAKTNTGLFIEAAYSFTFHVDKYYPLTTSTSADPNPVNLETTAFININSVIDDTWGGSRTYTTGIVAAEYFIDEIPADHNGTGVAMDAPSGWGGSTVSVQGVLEVSLLNWIEGSTHKIYVHGLDEAGHWAPVEEAPGKYVQVEIMDTHAPVFDGVKSVVDPKIGGNLTVYWDPAEDVSPLTYTLTMMYTGGSMVVEDIPEDQTLYKFSGLTNGQDYTFKIHAIDAHDNVDDNDAEASRMPSDETPPLFSGLGSTSVEPRGGVIKLSWDEARDEDTDPEAGPLAYYVYKSTKSNFQPSEENLAVETNELEHIFTGLTNGKSYYFVVKAGDSYGNLDENVNGANTAVKPKDSQQPHFDGITRMEDDLVGGRIHVYFDTGSDSNTDPEGKILYTVWMSKNPNTQPYSEQKTLTRPKGETSQELNISINGLTNQQNYYFYVSAEDDSGNENESSDDSSAIAGTPTDQMYPEFSGVGTVTDEMSSGTLTLEWEEAVDANTDPAGSMSYRVFVSTQKKIDYASPNAITTQLSYVATGLSDGMTYYCAVRAQDDSDNIDPNSRKESAIPTDQVGPEFSGLKTAVDTEKGGSIALTWDEAVDPSTPITYWIYRSTNKPFNPSPDNLVSTTQGTMFEDDNNGNYLKNNVYYHYIVRASDSEGNYDDNELIRSDTPSDLTPPAFNGIKSLRDTGAGGSVEVTWNKATNEPSTPVEYNIYRSSSSSKPAVPVATVSTTSYTDGNLTNGEMYYYWVNAEDYYGNEDENNVVESIMPLDTVPPEFDGLNMVRDAEVGGEVILYWSSAKDDSESLTYSIFRGQQKDNLALVRDGVIGTEYRDTGLANGLSYYFQVRAKDAYDNMDKNSVVLNVTPTAPNTEPGLTLGKVSPDDGDTETLFTFSVEYSDEDEDPPQYVRLYLNGVPYEMTGSGSDYEDGVTYRYSDTMAEDRYLFYFEVMDEPEDNIGTNGDAYRVRTKSNTLNVEAKDSRPKLESEGYEDLGDDEYKFHVTYTDADGDNPDYVEVYIDGTPYTMSSSGTTYKAGVKYEYRITLSGGDHSFYFKTKSNDFTQTTTHKSLNVPEEETGTFVEEFQKFLDSDDYGVKGYVLFLMLLIVVFGLIAAAARPKDKNMVTCPACEVQLRIPTDQRPVQVTCPNCQAGMIIR